MKRWYWIYFTIVLVLNILMNILVINTNTALYVALGILIFILAVESGVLGDANQQRANFYMDQYTKRDNRPKLVSPKVVFAAIIPIVISLFINYLFKSL